MATEDASRVLLAAVTRILRPLVRVLLRQGVGYTTFTQVAKRVYFDVARDDLALPGKRQTGSRISTMTGLSRKEVARLEALPANESLPDVANINRAARVISGWVRDPGFHDATGNPAELNFDQEGASFTALVKKYSGDIPPRTIADELIRVGAIDFTPGGRVRLKARAYVAPASERDKLVMLGTDVASLAGTIEHNLLDPSDPRFQRKVAYSSIPAGRLPEIRTRLSDMAQSSLESMDQLLAREAAPEGGSRAGTAARRLGVGIYYFEEEIR